MRGLVITVCVLWAVGCGSESWDVVGPEEWDIVLQLSNDAIFTITVSPDSALFVTTFRGAIYRGQIHADGVVTWERIFQFEDSLYARYTLTPYAPNRHTLFGIMGSRIYRWDEGEALRHEPTVISDSTEFCGDFIGAVRLDALWARSETDVYAVGEHGHILHYDGQSWLLEENELYSQAPSICYAAYAMDLRAVGGDDQNVYAGAGYILRKGNEPEWEILTPPGDSATRVFVFAIASMSDGVLLGGEFVGGEGSRIRFFRPATQGSGWKIVAEAPPPFERASLFNGGAGPGNVAVFWDFDGLVFVVQGGGIEVLRFDGLHGFLRGAVGVGRAVFAAARIGDSPVVVRYYRW